ncbi:MAG: NUDIX domain-containing protein [candidate division WOR-3 bacterium]|nr:MAG: NUDIX domain-containing protein [candidate division WOR-3 bacterium]
MKDAVAVVLKRGDEYLLIKRAKHGVAEDFWCPITGAVEDGETHAQAVIREANEEMGIIVEPLRKVWECPTNDREYLLHWWHAKIIRDDIAVNPDEVKEYCWLTYDQMQNLPKMFDADRIFFRDVAGELPDS